MTGIDVSEYIKSVIDKNIYREFVKFLIRHNAYSFYLYKLTTSKYKIDTNRYKMKIPYDNLILHIISGDYWGDYFDDSRKTLSLATEWLRQIKGR